MLSIANMPAAWWKEVAHLYVYIHNKLPQKLLDNISSWEVLHGKQLHLGAMTPMHTFGSRAYMVLPDSKRVGRKLSRRTEKMVYVIVGENGASFQLYNPSTQ